MRPTRALINLSAIEHNLGVLKAQAPDSRVMAVVKANAYGHGAVPVARALGGSVDALAVAFFDEALLLRESGIDTPLVLLEGPQSPAECASSLKNLVWVVHSDQQLRWLDNGESQSLWLKANIGMNRLGFAPEDLANRVQRCRSHKRWSLQGIMTHYACADDLLAGAEAYPERGRLAQLRAQFPDLPFSSSNSAAILRRWGQSGEWLRPGIALYGASPFSAQAAADLGLQPAMTLESELIAVRSLSPGDRVGYGATWGAHRETRMGIVPVGYADGLLRALSSTGRARIAGQYVPIIGRVSMDMIALDLGIDSVLGIGETVELWGAQLSVDEQARAASSIGYELLAGLTARVPRVYA